MNLTEKPPSGMTSSDQDKHIRNAELEKDIIKEAIREWMDDKYAVVGKWTVGTVGVLLTGALIYLTLIVNGWHK